MNEIELPEDWVIKSLKDVTSKVTDGSHNPPKAKATGKPMLSARNIQNNSIVFDDFRFIGENEFNLEYKRANVEEGDILLTIVGTIGRCAVVKSQHGTFTLQRSVALIKPLIDAFYLLYYFQSPNFQRLLEQNARGTAQKGVYLKVLNSLPVLVPPLPVQHQIVARIEELFSELDAGIQELQTALKRLKIYRQAVIDQAFDKTGKDWETARLGNLAELRGGVTKGRHLDGKETVSVPYLRVANVQDGYLDLDEIKNIEVLLTDVQKYKLMDQDILFTEGGDKDKLGRGTVWNNQIPDCIHQNHVFRARVKRELLAPVFLTYAAKTTQSRQYFYKVAKQTTNLASINIGQLSSLEIPLPDLVIQNQIILEVEVKLSEADAMEATIRQELVRSENLRQSILKRAFEGKLVSQAYNMVSKQTPADNSQMVTNDGQLSLF